MKALLLKDCCVLWKQLRFFLLFILVFSALPGGFNGVFAVTYAALLPYSCVAYDERSKWDQLAAMMPYSPRDLVLSRYVLGWIAAAGACALSLVLQGVFSTLLDTGFYPITLVLAFFACLATLAITMPLIFRFGVERGRLIMSSSSFWCAAPPELWAPWRIPPPASRLRRSGCSCPYPWC